MTVFQSPYPDQYDVIVAGGGPAGIAAAVSSARLGAKTALIERYGILGGMLTSGHVQPILGRAEGRTMYDEITALLQEGHEDVPAVATRNGREVGLDLEEAKHRLLKLCVENGVYVYLQTPVADVIMDENRVTGLVVLTPKGLSELHASVVVDATGDGFAAMRAGAPFEVGRESDGKCQPATLEFTVENVDNSHQFFCYGGSDPVTLPDGRCYSEVCREACARGELPENVSIVRIHHTLRPDERNINATQANGFDTLTPQGNTAAEYLLREQIPVVVEFLRKHAPGFENCRVKSSATTLGVRETRRFIGDYVISDEDVEKGARHDDVVVHKAWFLIDIHNPTGGGQAEKHSQPATPYDIPYRSLLPKGIEGLLLSGRNISGTHRAHASYRVMGVAIPTGQAAGTAAALSALKGCTPRELDYHAVQKSLADYGVQLDAKSTGCPYKAVSASSKFFPSEASSLAYDGSRTKLYMRFRKQLPSAQGMAIHDERAYLLYDSGWCAVHDLNERDAQPLDFFPLGSMNEGTPSKEYRNHSNQAMFGGIHYEGNSIPLLYVTVGSGTGADADGFYYRCAVENIVRRTDENGVEHHQAETLQTICYQPQGIESTSFEAPCWGCPAFFPDPENGFLYIFSARYRTKRGCVPEGERNAFIITKFELPKLSDGSLVHLTSKDILDQFVIPSDTFFTQGGLLAGDQLIYTFGCPKHGYPDEIMIFDVRQKKLTAHIRNLDEALHGEELESCAIYSGKLMLNTNDGGIYTLCAVPNEKENFDE